MDQRLNPEIEQEATSAIRIARALSFESERLEDELQRLRNAREGPEKAKVSEKILEQVHVFNSAAAQKQLYKVEEEAIKVRRKVRRAIETASQAVELEVQLMLSDDDSDVEVEAAVAGDEG